MDDNFINIEYEDDHEGENIVYNVPSVWTTLGPSTLELAKALRDCLKLQNFPTKPLDDLIDRYDNVFVIGNESFTISTNPPRNTCEVPEEPFEETGFGD